MNPGPAQKHSFYYEMSKLLEAGFGVRQAGRVVLDTKPPAAQAAMLRAMDAGLEQGKTIVEAFGTAGFGITDLEKGIVGAGERGGRLAQAFRHLADYFELLAQARRDIIQSLIYPLILLHLGVLASVVPGGLMQGRGTGEIVLSLILSLGALYLGLAIAGFLAALILRAAPSNAVVDRWLNRIPLIGGARRNMAMARFTKVYHTGVLAGLPMVETVTMAADASHSGIIRAAGKTLAARAAAGEFLGPGFVDSSAFPSAFARSYATAEEAGGLDKDLERWSKVYQEDAVRGSKAVAVALPKIFYGIVLIFVAWKIIGFYSGYAEMLDNIGTESD